LIAFDSGEVMRNHLLHHLLATISIVIAQAFHSCTSMPPPQPHFTKLNKGADDIAELYSIPDPWFLDRHQNLDSIDDYKSRYERSINDPKAFWAEVGAQFEWRGLPLSESASSFNFDRTKGEVYVEWFKGSRTNLAFNALDRQIALGKGNQIALLCERNEIDETGLFQPDTYTYTELRDEVS
jgi:hypothetical protein